jgi:hypothetical protein
MDEEEVKKLKGRKVKRDATFTRLSGTRPRPSF